MYRYESSHRRRRHRRGALETRREGESFLFEAVRAWMGKVSMCTWGWIFELEIPLQAM